MIQAKYYIEINKKHFRLTIKSQPEILFYAKLEYFGADNLYFMATTKNVPYLNINPTAFKGREVNLTDQR